MSSIDAREGNAAGAASGEVDHAPARAKRQYWQVVRLLVAGDFLATFLAAVVATLVVEGSASPNWTWLGVSVVGVPVAFAFYSLYERDRRQIAISTLDETRDVLNALGIASFLLLAIGIGLDATRLLPHDTITVFVFWIAGIVLIPITRAVLRARVLPHVVTPQTTIVVGAGRVGQTVASKILRHPEYNLRLIGFVDDDPAELDAPVADLPVLGSEDDLVEVIRRHGVHRVVLAFSRWSHEELLDLVRGAGLRDVHLSIIPRYFEIIAANVGVAELEGVPVLELPEARLSRFARWSKRMLDLLLTVPALMILSPILVLIAVAIKLDSRGPVFFRQQRTGAGEKRFEILKFRTMVDGAERLREELLDRNESDGPLFKIRDDPRVTRVGRVLRRYSLDELPQLVNVLRGEMSLVGPRPFVVHEDEKIDGWARRRLDLTPGVTGVWQVLGRNDIGYDEMVKLDYLYVTNWSLFWDLKLILKTVPILFSRHGY